jgi:hypothetical protein
MDHEKEKPILILLKMGHKRNLGEVAFVECKYFG